MLLNCGVGEDSWDEIQPVHPKGDQSWVFIGRTDVEAETPILWPPDAKSRLIWKDPDAGKDWRREEKGTTEDEVAGWHHWLDGRESEWTLGVGDGQGSLVCCNSWGRKESDTSEWLNWTELKLYLTACDPMDCSTPGFSVLCHHPEFAQIHLHWVGDIIQPSHPLLPTSPIFFSNRVFSNDSALCINWPKYWRFSFSVSAFSEYSGLISFMIDWFDFLTIQGNLKSLHNSKLSILWCSVFSMI